MADCANYKGGYLESLKVNVISTKYEEKSYCLAHNLVDFSSRYSGFEMTEGFRDTPLFYEFYLMNSPGTISGPRPVVINHEHV